MADAITIKALQDASLDAKSLEEVVNGNEVKQVTTRKGETYPSVKKAIKALFENGGIADRFETLADLQTSPLVDGAYALVADDTDDKNGIYIKEGGAWLKSKYDVFDFLSKLIAINEHDNSSIFTMQDGGGASVIKMLKSGELYLLNLNDSVQGAIKSNAPTYAESPYIFDVVDNSNNSTLRQTQDGDLLLPNIGNLTVALNNISRELSTGTIKQVDEHGVLLTAKDVLDANIISHPIYGLRIPAITRIAKNKYILFFEARNIPQAGQHGDFAQISAGTCTFTVNDDNTITKNDIALLHESFIDSGDKQRTFMNPCGVLLDDGSILCMYVRRYPSTSWDTSEHELYVKKSTDGGKTWSAHKDVSSIKGGKNLVCPCSQGFIKRYGSNKGRIIFPVWTTGQYYEGSDFRSGYIYSDDNGVTWQEGGYISTPLSNEVQAAQDVNGDIYLCCRIESDSNKKEIWRLPDSTVASFEKVTTNTKLNYEPVMTGFIQHTNWFDGGQPFFIFTSCITANTRKGLLIRLSHDGGNSWSEYIDKKLEGSSVGYTAIESVGNSKVIVVCEGASGLEYRLLDINLIEGK